MRRTERFGWLEWLIVLGFVLSIALVGVSIVRSVHMVSRLHQDEPIRPWMTVPYVAHSYHVPSSILYRALGLPPGPHDRRPLADIARLQHRSVQDVIADLQKAITQARTSPLPSPTDPPGRAVSLSGQLLAAFALYGLPVLFGVVLLGSAGVPIPGVVVVIVAGALVQQGELNLWWVVGLACSAAILGDNIGYALGRFGRHHLAHRFIWRLGGESRLKDAEALAGKWSGFGIFLSRWLLTPFGALINLASGMGAYPYPRFLLFDVSGEVLWAIEYVLLGELLSNRIATVMDLLGQVSWVVVGLIGAIIFGWLIVRRLRQSRR